MKYLILFAFAALSAPLFAQLSSAGICNSAYESCIQDCCDQCGSTTERNSAGDLVCNVGTASEINQQCVDACLPCSESYQSCLASTGSPASDIPPGSTPSSSCCGSAFVLLGILGIAGYSRMRAGN